MVSIKKFELTRQSCWFLIGIAVAVLAVYLQTVTYDFINMDDDLYISKNPFIVEGLSWASVFWAFQADLFTNALNVDYWQPVTILSRIIDITLFGTQAGGHHFVNTMIHLLNTILVFLLFSRMTGKPFRSLMIALFFGLHPLQVEAVAWVTARKDLLSGFFALLAIGAYLRYVQNPLSKRFWWVSGFFALSLMSKPALVLLPLILLALDAWPLGRIQPKVKWPQLVMEKWPLFLMALISFLIIRFAGGSISNLESTSFSLSHFALNLPQYIEKVLYPRRLILFELITLTPMVVFKLAFFSVLAIVFWVYAMNTRNTKPYYLVGIIWFLGSLLSSLGLVLASRYAYFAIIGAGLILIWGFSEAFVRWRLSKAFQASLAAIMVISYLIFSFFQTGHWKDTPTILDYILSVRSDHYKAHNNYGAYLQTIDRDSDAIEHFVKAVWIKPRYPDAHNNLAVVLSNQGKLDVAKYHFNEILKFKDDYFQAHTNLGHIYLEEQDYENAIYHYQKAIALQPDFASTQGGLGAALLETGHLEEAISYFKIAESLDPSYWYTYFDWGYALAKLERYEEAEQKLRRAIELKPDFAAIYSRLSYVLGSTGRHEEAVAVARQALKLNPNELDAKLNLSTAERRLKVSP